MCLYAPLRKLKASFLYFSQIFFFSSILSRFFICFVAVVLFPVALVLKGVKIQSKNEESLILMVLSWKRHAGSPSARRIGLTAKDHTGPKSPGKE